MPAPLLSEGVRVRLLHAAHGDPRAAAELAAALTPRQAIGLDPLPAEPFALAPALLRAHRRDVRALPDDTRFLLLLAAADQYPIPTHAYERAVTAAGLNTRLLDAAEAAGIADTTAQGVVFRDAWTRIAVYESASTADRRAAHRLLAGVLSGEGERPGRSWHRAATALGPSRRLAAELRLAAKVARAIGEPALASALAERAAALTPDPAERMPLLARAATTPSPAASPSAPATPPRPSTPCSPPPSGTAATTTRTRPPICWHGPPRPPSTPGTCAAAGRPPPSPTGSASCRRAPSARWPPRSRDATTTPATSSKPRRAAAAPAATPPR